MRRTAFVALSLLCLSAGAALAAGDGDGPFGVPESANSLPQGFLNGTLQYSDEQAVDNYLIAQAHRDGLATAPATASQSTGQLHASR